MRAWREEWISDPAAFRAWFRRKREEAHAARDAGDEAAMYRCSLDFAAIAQHCANEPMASEYDRAVIKLLQDHAMARLDVVDFAGSVKCLEHSRLLLEALARRQSALGRTPWPCSVEWLILLMCLADAKWKGPNNIRDAVMPPLEMIERYELLEDRVRGYIKERKVAEHDRPIHLLNLAWCGVKQLAIAMRFCPGHLPGLKKRFNSRHEGLLDDKSVPFYWDFRISEGWWEGAAKSRELTLLFAERRVALRRYTGPIDILTGFDHSSDAELVYLKRHPASKLKRSTA